MKLGECWTKSRVLTPASERHFLMTKRSTSSPSAVSCRTESVRPSTSATVSECTLETCLKVKACQDAGSSCCSGL